MSEIAVVGFRHRGNEVIARHGVAVMEHDVAVKPLAETVFTEHGLQHADYFRALFIHGHRVEIVDLAVAVRTDRMRHGARVFRELRGS